MPKYKVQSPQFTLGQPGDIVDLDDVPGLNVRALVKCGIVTVVADKPKRKTRKAAAAVEGGDD